MPYDNLLMLTTPTSPDPIFTVSSSADNPIVEIDGTRVSTALQARIVYKNASTTGTSGTRTATFKIQHSDSREVNTFVDLVSSEPVSLTTTAQSGTLYLPVLTPKKYVRLVLVLASSGTPTVTYLGGIINSKV